MANSEDPDEMQDAAAFHQGLHCLLRLKEPSGMEKIHRNLEMSTRDPFKYTMCSPILIVSMYMRKTIRIQRVKYVPRLILVFLGQTCHFVMFCYAVAQIVNSLHAG